MSDLSEYEKSVDVDAPIRVVYNQWTQFEELPRFMSGVESVEQRADDMLHWKVDIAGVTREFDTRITEQIPDERIAWSSVAGTGHSGLVTFTRVDEETTRVRVHMAYEPEGLLENVGDKLGFISGRLEGDMEWFKEFIEDREAATGAWRGAIH